MINVIGDIGARIAAYLLWHELHTLTIPTLLANADDAFTVAPRATFTAIALLLFVGAVGKSAQFPLHVWLPDAMEGPTPVSALIHAATMVTAGVYLVARCTRCFGISRPRDARRRVHRRLCTAAGRALIALTQTDLKRMLAYSTVSQLGYMFLGLGAASAAQCGRRRCSTCSRTPSSRRCCSSRAGSVMHAMGDVIDMRRFGGFGKALPVTHWTFLCGALALAGVPAAVGLLEQGRDHLVTP